MNFERWAKIEEIFQAALDSAPAARAALIRERCGGDRELSAEVEKLVENYDTGNPFLEAPVWDDEQLFQTTLRHELASSLEREIPGGGAEESPAGQTIGAYRLIEELGRGGMGVVYLAERADDFRRRVAVKIVKRGMDTDFILRRFRQERQVLAALDHPFIARLLDGGATADGRPFLAMEYVEGLPIDRFCDERKLPVAARLKLFLKVCAAVGYSHQRLIVHRDIKPSNILVAADGTPKLLDFGIARLLDPALASDSYEPTATNARMMTPDYASPEQLRGEAATTASDVYSLGVLLYYLLAGCLPFKSSLDPLDSFARLVSEQKPERPSASVTRGCRTIGINAARQTNEQSSLEIARRRQTQPDRLRRRLADDLDNIVLKALRKEPDRRYPSVAQLSEDIERHLAGLPVTARGDDFIYKTRKFAVRHKAGVIAAALIVITLVSGIAATSRQASIANRERARAEAETERARRRFDDSRRLTESLMFELHDAIRDLQGATPARELLARRTLEHLDKLARDADDDHELQRELAIAYINLGNIQGNPFYPNLGDAGGALASYRKAEELIAPRIAADPSNAKLQRQFWLTQIRIGDVQAALGDTAGARESHARALRLIETLTTQNPADESLRSDLASSLDRQGNVLMKSNDARGALAAYRQALTIFEQSAAARPADDNLRRAVAAGYGKIGLAQIKAGEVGGALESYRKLLEINHARLAQNPANAVTLDDLGGSLRVYGDAQMAANDYRGAFESYRRQLEIYRQLAAADRANVRTSVELAISHNRLGFLQTRRGETRRAVENHEKAFEILRDLQSKNPQNVFVGNRLPAALYYLGDAYFAAASAESSGRAKTHSYQTARSYFEQSKRESSRLPQPFDSFPAEVGTLSDIEKRIAACDVLLSSGDKN